jgi:hypothetical protein
MSADERARLFEYVLDRKNDDINRLERTIEELRDRNIRHDMYVVIAEVLIFAIGIGVGYLLSTL